MINRSVPYINKKITLPLFLFFFFLLFHFVPHCLIFLFFSRHPSPPPLAIVFCTIYTPAERRTFRMVTHSLTYKVLPRAPSVATPPFLAAPWLPVPRQECQIEVFDDMQKWLRLEALRTNNALTTSYLYFRVWPCSLKCLNGNSVRSDS